jgi:hypothetical protein
MSMGFPLSTETQALIAEIIRLDQITAQLRADEIDANGALQALQKKRIEGLIKPGSASPGAIEIKSATEKCLDLHSAIIACQAKRGEMITQISGSMLLDKKKREKEFRAEIEQLGEENEKLRQEFLTAMARAGVAQMAYLGHWKLMKSKGPGFSRLNESDQTFFGAEIDRFSAEAGIDGSYRTVDDRIQEINKKINALGEPIGTEYVEAAIKIVRQN